MDLTTERLTFEEVSEGGLDDLLHLQQQLAIGATALQVGQTNLGSHWIAGSLAGLGVHICLWLQDLEQAATEEREHSLAG